jgi:hypothetical protein
VVFSAAVSATVFWTVFSVVFSALFDSNDTGLTKVMRGGAPILLGARPVKEEERRKYRRPHLAIVSAQKWNAGSARMRSCPDKPSGRMTGLVPVHLP